ncbi:MAG: hypothetical protein GX444_08200 [Myxococcales bacterium]|nr:hypothetical protein [Myxococcales bacterium]
MKETLSSHDHNGLYVRKAECGLMRENFDLQLRSIKRLTWFVLGFQVMTIGGAVVKWVFS